VDLLTVVGLVAGLVVGFVLVVSYNRFVAHQHLIRNARSNVDTELRRRTELRRLIAAAETGPAFQTNAPFLELKRELALTEDRLQAAERFYNANVKDHNERIRSFPSVLVARLFRFQEAECFDIDGSESEGAMPAGAGSGTAQT
jgi:hypothetical protein